jgi:hypothetical protein
MRGKVRKGHTYYQCCKGATYTDEAAAEVHGGAKYVSVREGDLHPLIERFFDERLFGPPRIEALERQLRAQLRDRERSTADKAARLREAITKADAAIAAQVRAIEVGIDVELVSARIAQLKAEKQQAQIALADLPPDDPQQIDHDELAARLSQLPDLSAALRAAPLAVRRQFYDAFGLEVHFDKHERRVSISAVVTEAVAQGLQETTTGTTRVPVRGIAGAGFEPATFGL